MEGRFAVPVQAVKSWIADDGRNGHPLRYEG